MSLRPSFSLLNAIATRATTYPKLSLSCVGFFFALASVLAIDIRLDVDLNNMVPKGDPRFSYVFENLNRFSGIDRAFIAIEDTTPFDDDNHSGVISQSQTTDTRALIERLCADELDAWVWTNPETKKQEKMVRLIQGHHDASASTARIDTIVARSYLFLDNKRLDSVIKRLNPKYLNAKLKHGPSASVPAAFRDRDLLNVWSHYIDFWGEQNSSDTPLGLDGSYICSADRRFHVLMVYPHHPIKDMPFCIDIGKRLTDLGTQIHAHNKNLKVHMMGGYITAAADFHTVRESLLITFGSSFIGVILLFSIVYRSLRLVVLIAIGLVPAIIATLGITTLLIGTKLSLIATIFAAILIGLGVDFIIHLYNSYCWALNDIDEKEHPNIRAEAARVAICRVGPSITIGCMTSVSAFAVLACSDFRGLLELGIVSSIGLLVILLSLLIIVPAFLTLWGPRRAHQPKGLYGYGKLITKRPRLMGGIALSIIAASITVLVCAPKLFTLDDNLRNLRPYNKQNEDTLKTVAQLGLRFGNHRVVVFGTGSEAVLNESLAFLDSLEHLRHDIPFTLSADLHPAVLLDNEQTVAIQGAAITTTTQRARYVIMTPWGQCSVNSINSTQMTGMHLLEATDSTQLEVIPAGTQLQLMALLGESTLKQLAFISPMRQHHNLERLRDEVDWTAIHKVIDVHKTPNSTHNAAFFADMHDLHVRVQQQQLLLPQELLETPMRTAIQSFYSAENGQDFVMLQLNVLHDRKFIPLDEFRAAMGIALDTDGMPAQRNGITIGTFGIPTISNYMQKTIVNDFIRLTSVAMIVVIIVLFIGVRQPLHVLLSLMTLGAGLLISLAIMHICKTPWNVLNIAVVPLIIGIGIDNSVHFLHTLKHHSFDKEGIIKTITETGHPIMMTALTSIIGFTSLLLNSYRGIQGIGALAAIGIGACMLMALLGLPLLVLGINKIFGKD